MTRDAMAIRASRGGSTQTDPRVWDRLWQSPTSPEKDDALITRERRGPRWGMIVGRLEATFGSIKGLRTVELGSGRGDLSVLLAQGGAEVTLLDASPVALGQARSRFQRHGLAALFEQVVIIAGIESKDGRFDVALSSGVIEHFAGDERTRAVEVHHSVLRPGGLVIISVPHAWCIPYRVWKLYLETRGWWPYGMERPYSRRELVRRARAAGFDQVEDRCLGFWQSVSDHWGRSLLGLKMDWADRESVLDCVMGMTLLLFGRRSS